MDTASEACSMVYTHSAFCVFAFASAFNFCVCLVSIFEKKKEGENVK